MDELGVGLKQIFIFSNSRSAICFAKNPVFHVQTKHIVVRFQFVRDIIREGRILFQKIETVENLTDLLTKLVIAIKFNH